MQVATVQIAATASKGLLQPLRTWLWYTTGYLTEMKRNTVSPAKLKDELVCAVVRRGRTTWQTGH